MCLVPNTICQHWWYVYLLIRHGCSAQFRFTTVDAVNFELSPTDQTSAVVYSKKLFGNYVFCLHNECAYLLFDMHL